jgi:hypothetical protein
MSKLVTMRLTLTSMLVVRPADMFRLSLTVNPFAEMLTSSGTLSRKL